MNDLNLRSALKILRQEMDDDSGMMRVHRTRNRYKRKSPDWAMSDKAIREVLLTSFPKLAIDEKQRYRASRWARIIFLYYHNHLTYSHVAEELSENPNTILSTIRSIRRAGKGLRTNGKIRKGVKGRPKKIVSLIGA